MQHIKIIRPPEKKFKKLDNPRDFNITNNKYWKEHERKFKRDKDYI